MSRAFVFQILIYRWVTENKRKASPWGEAVAERLMRGCGTRKLPLIRRLRRHLLPKEKAFAHLTAKLQFICLSVIGREKLERGKVVEQFFFSGGQHFAKGQAKFFCAESHGREGGLDGDGVYIGKHKLH